jgi:vitamin B12 transporter
MLHYQYTDNKVDFARPTDVAEAFNERSEDLFSIKWDHQFSENISLFVKGYYHNWSSDWTERHNDLTNPGSIINISDKEFWGYEDYGVNTMGKFNLHKGMEYVLGYDHQSFSGRDDVLLIADQSEQVGAVYFQARTTSAWFENTSLAFGVRHNEQSDAGGTTVWNFSGKHEFNDSVFMRGNIGTAFRLPDAWQLFGNDPCCTQGNPALEGEESVNVNVALGGQLDNIANGLSWELIGFHRAVDNLIGSANRIRINSTNKVEMIGGELIASLAINPEWQTNLDFVYTDAEANGSDQQIVDIPRTTVKWNLNYQPQQYPLGLSLSLIHVGDVFSDVGGFFATGENAEHGDYTVVDLSGYYQLGQDGKHRLGFRAENLLDENYNTSIRTATRDNGTAYLYGNRGVPMSFHLNYTYRF